MEVARDISSREVKRLDIDTIGLVGCSSRCDEPRFCGTHTIDLS